MYNFKDITGQKFAKLTTISRAENNGKNTMWLCKCDCGNLVIVRSTHLTKSRTKSCGCLNKQINKNSKTWKGYEDISGDYYSNIKKGAKNRKIEFNITIQYLWELFINQDKKCALSGVELSFMPSMHRRKEGTSSLDRIDSSKGYIKGNIQWVHKNINKLKTDFPQDYFIEMCNLVSNYQCNKKL